MYENRARSLTIPTGRKRKKENWMKWNDKTMRKKNIFTFLTLYKVGHDLTETIHNVLFWNFHVLIFFGSLFSCFSFNIPPFTIMRWAIKLNHPNIQWPWVKMSFCCCFYHKVNPLSSLFYPLSSFLLLVFTTCFY